MKIAILMTCYNRIDTTLACLKRLFDQSLPNGCLMDVWLVDDASPDGTGDKVASSFPSVNVIKGSGSLFWCKGMRLAWESAAKSYDYDSYIWLNDDVMLNEGALTAILHDSYTLKEQNPCVLSGTMSSDNAGVDLVYGCYSKEGVLRPCGSPRRADQCEMSGNFVLIPKSVYDLIGPIYGGYSHAFGDTDYRMLMRKHDIPLYCSSVVSGVCPAQPQRYLQMREIPFYKRLKALFNPKGVPIHDVFIYRYRHWGVIRAVVSCSHVILKTLFFPGLVKQ